MFAQNKQQNFIKDSESKNKSTIKIGRKRMNGLCWQIKMIEAKSKVPGIKLTKTGGLDIILSQGIRVEELTDEELDLRLRQVQVEVPA